MSWDFMNDGSNFGIQTIVPFTKLDRNIIIIIIIIIIIQDLGGGFNPFE